MCLLLGYSVDTKGYKLMNLQPGAIRTCRLEDSLFQEDFTCESEYVLHLVQNTFQGMIHPLAADLPIVHIKTDMESYAVDMDREQPPVGVSAEPAKVTPKRIDGHLPSVSGRIDQDNVAGEVHSDESTISESRPNARKIKPTSIASRVDIAVPGTVPVASTTGEHSTPSSPSEAPAHRRRRPNVRLRDYVVNHVITQVLDIIIPASYKEARLSPQWIQWRAAMEEELRSLWSRQTWRLVRRTETNGAKVITCRWVYALKQDEHGCIKRYKARLVIHGFKQEFGVNFTETYAPVVRFESIRAAIYYAMQHG